MPVKILRMGVSFGLTVAEINGKNYKRLSIDHSPENYYAQKTLKGTVSAVNSKKNLFSHDLSDCKCERC